MISWAASLRQLAFILVLLGGLLLTVVGCGAEAAEAPADAAVAIRASHPTFTPTPPGTLPAAPQLTPVPQSQAAESLTTPVAATPAVDAASGTGGPRPRVIVNTALVNLRAGPSIDFPIITLVEQGQEFEIVGKNAAGDWWQICCHNDGAVWIIGEFADVSGATEGVPVVDPNSLSAASLQDNRNAASAPTATPLPPTAVPTTAAVPTTEPTATMDATAVANAGLRFDLIAQEQFPEPRVVRIFLYVYNDKTALDGYTLRVTKDGAEQPVNTASFGPNAGFTWPVADPRQRFQNMKVEFPGVDPAGVWQVELLRDGAPAGPAVTFTLEANEPERELYVRYKER
jgi:SH3-like domain-containing protein